MFPYSWNSSSCYILYTFMEFLGVARIAANMFLFFVSQWFRPMHSVLWMYPGEFGGQQQPKMATGKPKCI